jgi:dUTP pyrophosphatase
MEFSMPVTSEPPQVKIKLTNARARVPSYAHRGDACADVWALDKGVVPPHGRLIVETGIAMELPPGYRATLNTRSSTAAEGVSVEGGWIDNGYRGTIRVVLFNHTGVPFKFEPGYAGGRAIAQVAIEPFEQAWFDVVDELAPTTRGPGFGSSDRPDPHLTGALNPWRGCGPDPRPAPYGDSADPR